MIQGSTCLTNIEPALAPLSQGSASPVMVDPAFDDPEPMLDLIYRNAPYQQAEGRNGNRPTKTAAPWFRGTLAANGEPLVDNVESCFENPNFIAAAKEFFRAEIVRPLFLTINLYGPMVAGTKHIDSPFFRMPMDRSLAGLRYVMGASGLFKQWEVKVATAITWFYTGQGGGFDYWQDGPNAPFFTIEMPQWNVAMVGDNENMFHRVQACGNSKEYLPEGAANYDMMLCRGQYGWEIRNTHIGTLDYSDSQIRTSVLWKAQVFADEAEERMFDNHGDDLSLNMIADIFRGDFSKRGVSYPGSKNLTDDPDWMALLYRQYLGPANLS
jgi:hypothetical protein